MVSFNKDLHETVHRKMVLHGMVLRKTVFLFQLVYLHSDTLISPLFLVNTFYAYFYLYGVIKTILIKKITYFIQLLPKVRSLLTSIPIKIIMT